ncbi:hypothetical protein HPO96_29350 [Kribbella sandramycini]|uniref:Uncharacterized protein n=1 Tax=Kribbella sandramycini TaxID=60450 RepID=A0A7Y4P226_9ACTN|nr:hypothetical protein [Kribbella sandramycini]MBB6571718.1 hypothetical protein [Kribbella sandramycini]NOL44361.1 hypothetical protein [Kribbella sandramycini]
MGDWDKKSRRASRRFAARDGISYTDARELLIRLGYWGRGARFYDELLAEMDARGQSLTDLAQENYSGELTVGQVDQRLGHGGRFYNEMSTDRVRQREVDEPKGEGE